MSVPSIGVLELAFPVAGIGKRTRYAAEQLSFEDMFAQGGAVETDEVAIFSRAVLMNRLSD